VDALSDVRYRGNGWPGRFVAKSHGDQETRSCSYEESWGGVLSNHVQWRCKLCLDHTGEFADVAVGDPWYRPIRDGEAGSSLIVARSQSGREYVERAIDCGALVASAVEHDLLPRSQPNLLKTRGEVWGRLLGSRLAFAHTPSYRRLPSFRFWVSEISAQRKVRSVLGAARRCIRGRIAFKTVL
jgi:coenzyme F420 hydrogenase subunit beta